MYSQIEKINSVDELRKRVDEIIPQRFDMGYRKPTTAMGIEDVEKMIHTLVYHSLLVIPKAEIEQFREG